jgi:hypothetical protein
MEEFKSYGENNQKFDEKKKNRWSKLNDKGAKIIWKSVG